MLIEKSKPTAIQTLSFRVDDEGYSGIQNLSDAVKASPSVLMRLALSDLIDKQKRLRANTVKELMKNDRA
jgi:predicted transcriptional regulator